MKMSRPRLSFLDLFQPGRGPVKGEGPAPCPYMVVGESPGANEAWKNRPFVGKTGELLDSYLDGTDLPHRSDIYITNLFKYYDPHAERQWWSEQDKRWLCEELEAVKPKLIIALGRPAARFFLGDVDIESVHAIAWMLPAHRQLPVRPNAVIFPIVHPAAGFHNPEMSAWITYGFAQLATFLKGQFDARTLFNDPYPTPHYEELVSLSSSRLRELLRAGESEIPRVAVDTEGTPVQPWSLQFSVRPGTAYLIKAHRQDLLTAFHRCCVRMGARVAFHNALHDLGMMRAMGIPWEGAFDDTMVMAYLLQVEPQGLKPLCVRHCGMRMQSYEEVLGGAGAMLATDYLWSLFDIEELEYEQTRITEFEAKKVAGRRIKVLPKLPRSPLHKAVERCLRSKRPRQLWGDQREDSAAMARSLIGLMPTPTLNHVDPTTAIAYGCRDADGTLRLLHQLRPRLEAMGLA